MPKSPPTIPGTLPWYREKAKTNPDIAALVAMIDRLQGHLTAKLSK